MKKILQIMPVPNYMAVCDVSISYTIDKKPFVDCGEIGDSIDNDHRTCLLALVEDEGGHQNVIPLVWDCDTESFETQDDITDPDYHIAVVSREWLNKNSLEVFFNRYRPWKHERNK